jgi:ArsR family transcriptional regulator
MIHIDFLKSRISNGGVKMGDEMQKFKADFFKALSHPLRIHILELLSEGEKSVNEIQSILNKEGSAVSQQLSVLRAKNIVVGTKDGKRVLYSLRDPMIMNLLVIARKIFNNHLIDTISMLEELNETEGESIVKEG